MLSESRCCTKCGATKPLLEFSKAPRGKHGRKASCKACDAARHQAIIEAAGPRVDGRRKPRRAPLDPSTVKPCRKCGVSKPLSEFSLSSKATETRNAVYRSDCKVCCSERTKQWFRDNPGRAQANKRKANLAANYGLTVADYHALLRSQGGVCAICGKDEPNAHGRTGKQFRLSVDHCHQTGAVRGLLCQKCNRAIGLLGDDPVLMRKAISYLLRHRKNTVP
ncbi:endonuclease VII domain-containing protein [Streptomyces olivaceoviridis]|uniref:endonuclease VII domain-containing protein n=1 Tax=Streptomyces olivaceoviridis TaxID=1921 RepID=UPI0036C6240E